MVPSLYLGCFWARIQLRSNTPELSGRAFVSGMVGFGIKKLSVPNILSLFSLRKSAVVLVGGASLYRKYTYNVGSRPQNNNCAYNIIACYFTLITDQLA